ncbi:glutamate racemase [Succinimonas sp.]|uniref:glutamate racemase n=1 Tax=Succinimonas sp. TaxID=1936151 RepID=UPI00386AFF1F
MFKVLFFDSGVGGLSVYCDVMAEYPEIEPCFLFDNAFFPYGDKPSEFIRDRVTSLICRMTELYHFDMTVVACNTASTIALDALRSKISIPVVGVVPAIKPAARLTKKKIIGLLATPGTVARSYTHDLIRDFALGTQVLSIGTTELVRIAEDKLAGLAVSIDEIAAVLAPWTELPERQRPDVIVLGCTHFPHLKSEIHAVMPEAMLIDSGRAIGRRVKSLLSAMPQHEIANPEAAAAIAEGASGKDFAGGAAFCTDMSILSERNKLVFNRFGFAECRELRMQ